MLSVAWDALLGLVVKAHRTVPRSEDVPEVGEPVAVQGVATEGPLQGWVLDCTRLNVVGTSSRWGADTGEGVAQEVVMHQWDPLSLRRPNADRPVRMSRFVVLNFLFEAEKQTASRRNGSRLDGFVFPCQGYDMVMRQVDDYKTVEQRLKSGGGDRIVTSVLDVRGSAAGEQAPVTDTMVNDIFFLMSGVYGLWTRPAARLDYDGNDGLAAVSFRLTPVHRYHDKRTFINWLRTGAESGWGGFLQRALPGFLSQADRLGLREACNQITESQQPMSLQSQTAIIWLCLEHFSTHYLRALPPQAGVPATHGDWPLLGKLNRVNRDTKFLRKELRQRMAKENWSRTIRNPLFHEGNTGKGVGELWPIYYELLTLAVILLCKVCGYQGKLVVPKADGQEVLALDSIV